MKNFNGINAITLIFLLVFVKANVLAQSVADLRSGYGNSKTTWNATTGVLTFTESGSIQLPGTSLLLGEQRIQGQNSIWDIPDNVNEIVIKAGVTVNGQFNYQRSGGQSFKMITIRGENRNTSVVFGTNTSDFGTGVGGDYITFLSTGNAGLTINTLTSLNPKGWHSRNEPLGGGQMYIDNCRFIDTRGGFNQNSDGNHNANEISNSLFETGDDVFAQFTDMTQTITNCTVVLEQNAMPINFGYNGSNAVSGTMNFTNLVIEGDVGRNGPSLIQCHNRTANPRPTTKTINIDGLVFKPSNNNSIGALINADGTLTIQGTWTNVDINVKEYFFSGRQDQKPFSNANTGNLIICGSNNKTNTYNCTNSSDYIFIDHNGSGKRLRGNANNTVSTQNGGIGDWVQWEQQPTNSGYFFLVHKATGKKLQGNGSYVVSLVDPSKNGTWEQWKWVDAGGGWFRLENRGHNRWLHVAANGTGNWTIGPKTWTGNNTRWRFTSTSGGRLAQEVVEEEELVEGKLIPELLIYPNPVQDMLRIQGVDEEVTFKITNLSGKEVLFSKGKSQIDVSALKSGVYFLNILDHTPFRFIKK